MPLVRLHATLNRALDEAFFFLRPSYAPVRRARPRSDAPRSGLSLTFDDGPSTRTTPELLDMLAEHGARATFFIVGSRIAGNEDLLQRMISEGHEIGNHTYSHVLTTRLTPAQLRADLLRGVAAIESASAVRPRLARPPFGKDRRRFAIAAADVGARTILWSADSGDADKDDQDARLVYSRVTTGAEPGGIVLLHDGGASRRESTLRACEEMLPVLGEQGFELVTVSELLAGAGPRPARQ